MFTIWWMEFFFQKQVWMVKQMNTLPLHILVVKGYNNSYDIPMCAFGTE